MTLAAFVALEAAPGDRLAGWVGEEQRRQLSPAEVQAVSESLGLHHPPWLRYARWCGSLLQGDLGRSFRSGQPVLDEIAGRIGPTVELNLAAFALVAMIGMPLGWWAARRPRGPLDRWSAPVLLALYAAPSFWVALVLQDLLAVEWRLAPLYGRTPLSGPVTLGTRLHHLVLPALCLALHQLAFFARFARNTALAGWRSRAALCARAAGVPDGRVFLRHGVRPSLAPLSTLFGLLLPAFAAGALLIESIFAWPGVGSLFVSAIQSRDVPVVLGLTVLTGLLTVVGSLIADLLVFCADPRMRRQAHESH